MIYQAAKLSKLPGEFHVVTIDEDAAEILGIEELEYTFRNGTNAREFAANIQRMFKEAHDEACN